MNNFQSVLKVLGEGVSSGEPSADDFQKLKPACTGAAKAKALASDVMREFNNVMGIKGKASKVGKDVMCLSFSVGEDKAKTLKMITADFDGDDQWMYWHKSDTELKMYFRFNEK